jgi:hypothetical protein
MCVEGEVSTKERIHTGNEVDQVRNLRRDGITSLDTNLGGTSAGISI